MLTLSTHGDGAGGHDGCNRFFGRYEDSSHVAQPHGTISFPGLGQTLAGCPWVVERQIESYQEALADAKRYQVQGHRLRIRDGSGKVLNDHNLLLFDDAYTSEQASQYGHQQRKLALQWGVETALHSE